MLSRVLFRVIDTYHNRYLAYDATESTNKGIVKLASKRKNMQKSHLFGKKQKRRKREKKDRVAVSW